MSLDSVPKDMRGLRACKLCSMVKVGNIKVIPSGCYLHGFHRWGPLSLQNQWCLVVNTQTIDYGVILSRLFKEGGGSSMHHSLRTRPSECRCASNQFLIAYLCVFIGKTNGNPLIQFKETDNKRVLLAREVVRASLALTKWLLQVPEIN